MPTVRAFLAAAGLLGAVLVAATPSLAQQGAAGGEWRIKQRVLLRPVRRVVRRVQIDRDAPRPPAQTAAMALDDPRGQRVCHAVEHAAVDRVLQPRQRRQRGQRLTRHRIPANQQLVDRVVGETLGVVAVRMTAGDAEEALAEQVRQRVPNLVRRAPVEQTPGERLDHLEQDQRMPDDSEGGIVLTRDCRIALLSGGWARLKSGGPGLICCACGLSVVRCTTWQQVLVAGAAPPFSGVKESPRANLKE